MSGRVTILLLLVSQVVGVFAVAVTLAWLSERLKEQRLREQAQSVVSKDDDGLNIVIDVPPVD